MWVSGMVMTLLSATEFVGKPGVEAEQKHGNEIFDPAGWVPARKLLEGIGGIALDARHEQFRYFENL